MTVNSFQELVKSKLELADIQINGRNPWDIQVTDPRFFERVVRHGSMGLGTAYMDGWFDAEKLDETIHKILSADLSKHSLSFFQKCKILAACFFTNQQSKKRAYEVGEKHYDLGNDLFIHMLDKRLAYSCAYWKGAKNLDEAQENKLELICKKLGLEKGKKVLDIGCGWGSFLSYAAEKYGVEATGITVSVEQKEYIEDKFRHLPIQVRFQDYRDLKGEKFDYVVSVGQMEHVGYKNYRNYMKIVENCLKDDGLFLLHTIGKSQTSYTTDPWIEKYIFPNGMIPSVSQIIKAADGLFVMEDWHNFGPDYDKTLLAWYRNFSSNWEHLKKSYDHRFYRMWKYYLLTCAGAFRARDLQLWQIVYSKKGVRGGYHSVR